MSAGALPAWGWNGLPRPLLPVPCPPLPGDNWCEDWVATYDNPNGYEHAGLDEVTSMAVSPDGRHVYITGMSRDNDTGSRPVPGSENTYSDETHWDIATAAYVAATGERLWVVRYNGPDDLGDIGASMEVSEDGTRVYVAGFHNGSRIVFGGMPETADFLLLAYSASSGALLWSASEDLQGRDDWGLDVAVAPGPGGERVYVSGTSRGQSTSDDIALVSYEGTTGERLWSAMYDGPAHLQDYPFSLRASPTGDRVFVTGWSARPAPGHYDYVTLAYGTGTAGEPGERIWEARYHEGQRDGAYSLQVSPDGSRVFVTGMVDADSSDVATIAYDSATGEEVWVSRYSGQPGTRDEGYALAVAPDGSRVYVTGTTVGNFLDYLTLAYDAEDGSFIWSATYTGPSPRGLDYPAAIAVSPEGSRVYVTGESTSLNVADCPPCVWLPNADSATVAYDAATGTQIWAARHNSSPTGLDSYAEPEIAGIPWASIAIHPGGSKVYVSRTFAYLTPTGSAEVPPDGNFFDYGVIAYSSDQGFG